MANTVEILVKGTDQSGVKAIKGAADETKRLGNESKGAGAGLKLAALGAAGLVGGGLVKFLKDSNAEARESQKVNAQTAAVLKSTGGAAHVTAKQIGDLSMAISNKVGIDDEAIQSGANMLLTFTNVRNEVGKGNDIFNQATQTVTDMSVALGQDMKSSAIQLGKALNDPIKGVTALQRVGVTFTEDQKKQIKTLMDHNNILGAQKIILHELSKEFGGSAAAQATAGDKAKVAWKNFQEAVGTMLLPAIDKAETWFATKLVPVLQNEVIPAIIKTVSWVKDHLVPALVKDIGPAVQATAKWVKDTLVPALVSLGKWIGDHQQQVTAFGVGIAAAITAFKGYKVIKDMTLAVKGLTLAMAENPVGAIILGLIVLGTWFVITYKKSREFRDNVGDAFSDVKIWALETGQWVINYLYIPMLTAFSGIIHAAAATFGWLPFGIGQKLHDAAAKMDEFRRKADADLHGIKADINTEQAKMKIRDLQRLADSIRQNKVPGMKANTVPAQIKLWEIQRQINGLQGKTVNVGINEITYVARVPAGGGTLQGAGRNFLNETGGVFRGYATGGAFGRIGSINERGPELVRLPTGSVVYPTGQSKGMWQEANRGKIPEPIVLEIHSGGTRLDDLLVEVLRKAVRVRGGNVQLVLGR